MNKSGFLWANKIVPFPGTRICPREARTINF